MRSSSSSCGVRTRQKLHREQWSVPTGHEWKRRTVPLSTGPAAYADHCQPPRPVAFLCFQLFPILFPFLGTNESFTPLQSVGYSMILRI